MKLALFALRVAVTLVVVLAALLAARWMWIRYQVEPWTRDGRVRADVVQIAPDVSALVEAVDVNDNQPVRKGERLFALDPRRFQVAVQQADAAVQSQAAALAQARREDARNHRLGELVAGEVDEQGSAKVAQLQAGLAQAEAARAAARLNLTRAAVYAPMDGVVADATLHPGDYLAAGRPALGLVDSATLHVDGYFEETKLNRIRVGDPAWVQLIGDKRRLPAHVVSVSPGIVDRERSPSGDLLPNVNPTFSWVRLAQRIPVRIELDRPPADLQLIAGRTATVFVEPRDPARRRPRFWSWSW